MLIGYIQLESHIILSTDHYIRKLADEDMAILFNIKPGQKPYHTVQNKLFNNSCKGKSDDCSDDPTYQSPVEVMRREETNGCKTVRFTIEDRL